MGQLAKSVDLVSLNEINGSDEEERSLVSGMTNVSLQSQ